MKTFLIKPYILIAILYIAVTTIALNCLTVNKAISIYSVKTKEFEQYKKETDGKLDLLYITIKELSYQLDVIAGTILNN